jgi:hypothetical protein
VVDSQSVENMCNCIGFAAVRVHDATCPARCTCSPNIAPPTCPVHGSQNGPDMSPIERPECDPYSVGREERGGPSQNGQHVKPCRTPVVVPPGAVWWADGVLSDADFLRMFAEGLAFVDPRAQRLLEIAERIK